MEAAGRVGLEARALGLVAIDLRHLADAVALQAAVQRRAGQVRNGGLQRVEAVVERQERVTPKGYHDRFVLRRPHRRTRILRTRTLIGNRGPLPPLRDRLLVDPVALRERPQARLTMLDRSTDRFSRCGAAVKNLARCAFLHSSVKGAPSCPRIKHLAQSRSRITLSENLPRVSPRCRSIDRKTEITAIINRD